MGFCIFRDPAGRYAGQQQAFNKLIADDIP